MLIKVSRTILKEESYLLEVGKGLFGGGKHSDQGTQNHPHGEELPAGGGQGADQGTQNHPYVESYLLVVGKMWIKVPRTILMEKATCLWWEAF